MSEASPPTRPARPALLIVDDEIDVLESLEHLFHRRYHVLAASSGDEAIARLESEDVQVILCDQRMPSMTGDEVLRRARTLRPDAMRLLFTGYADIQAVTRAINQGGIFRYILKPWDSDELEAVVAQAVEQYELVAERRRLVDALRAANEQLVAVNRELADSNALKSAFLEVASHELNTPITIIQGLSDLLCLTSAARDENDRRVVEQIALSSRQLGRLVATMLKLTQTNDYRGGLRTEPIELTAVLHAVADQLQPIADARGLSLNRDIGGDLGTFQADADKLRDVVANLLSNAVKFTPDGGEIWLSASLAAPEQAEIVVADKGIGLDEKAVVNMFEPFFTEVDPATHSSGDFGFRKRGMGLGLSLVKRFVELHGGRVWAESRPNEGTKVTVRWPRAPRPPSPKLLQSESGGNSHGAESAGKGGSVP